MGCLAASLDQLEDLADGHGLALVSEREAAELRMVLERRKETGNLAVTCRRNCQGQIDIYGVI